MAPPAEVVGLVERFEEQREDYRRGRYNEAQLREDFLNRFFKAVGWDDLSGLFCPGAFRRGGLEAACVTRACR